MLTVSIVTYKVNLDELATCLRCLDNDMVDTVYVVDNASQQSVENFVSRYPKVRYIPSANRGYGAGHNKAMRLAIAAGSPYHLVINSDLQFNPAILTGMLAKMEEHPQWGLLHPAMVNTDGTPQYTARLLPTPFDLILRRFLPHGWFARRRRKYLCMDRNLAQPLDVPYVQGSFMLLRTAALKCCGLFDERFFMYPEDIDLTRRINDCYSTVRHPAYTVVHAHKAASYASARMLRVHIVNMIRYFNKWGWFFDAKRRKCWREAR